MKYKWLASHSNIPEMDIGEFARLMKEEFSILHEPVKGRPYWFRFTGSPYNPFVDECRSLSVMGHNRGTRLSPHHIKHILAKFGIEEAQFKDAYNRFFDISPPSPIPPPGPPASRKDKPKAG